MKPEFIKKKSAEESFILNVGWGCFVKLVDSTSPDPLPSRNFNCSSEYK